MNEILVDQPPVEPVTPASLAAYVDRRGEWLGRCAFLLTRDHDAALDLVQDTLLKAWQARARIRDADNPEAYLMRMMLNLHRDQHRRQRRRPTTLSMPATNHDQAAVGDELGAVDDASELAQALGRLNHRQRAVIVLRYWADYDDARIADVIGCRRATVRSVAARAMQRLRSDLERKDQ